MRFELRAGQSKPTERFSQLFAIAHARAGPFTLQPGDVFGVLFQRGGQ
jgi:hypothetical protein